jgi:hypothetical protein
MFSKWLICRAQLVLGNLAGKIRLDNNATSSADSHRLNYFSILELPQDLMINIVARKNV